MAAYRYGFNGQEKSDEIKGEGNQIDFKYRGFDPRIGRFLSVDPMFKEFPFYSSYQFASNSPILAVDLEGLESNNIKNKTETKTAQKTKPTDPSKILDIKTVNRNFDNSNYISNHNPLNTDGSDSFEPKAQDDQDANAKEHDMSDATFGNRTLQGLNADFKFVAKSQVIVLKKLENDIFIPMANINPVLTIIPNKDNTTGKELTARTAYKRAAVSGTVLALWTATKVALAVTYDPAVKAYDATVDFVNDVKYKTVQGLNSIQNWSPH